MINRSRWTACSPVGDENFFVYLEHDTAAERRSGAAARWLALLLIVALVAWPTWARAQAFSSTLVPTGLSNPTSIAFGPDDRLYASEQHGMLRAYALSRSSDGEYSIAASEAIDSVKLGIVNHDDDGSACSAECGSRQVTGIALAGTATHPVLYVSSSDIRHSVGEDSGLDTNSGVISRLSCDGGIVDGLCSGWTHVDIVRGLPRSEENHATNGLQFDAANHRLLLAVGGNANRGAPSSAFSGNSEYWFSAAILSIDLAAIAAIESANGGPFVDPRSGTAFVHDLLTLDDPTRPNIDNTHPDFPYGPNHPWHALAIDLGDPFGGNNGRNQAIPQPGGPVQVFSPGYRNPYDVLLTASGELYTWDNGSNSGWGGTPLLYAADGTPKGWSTKPGVVFDGAAGDYCTNEYNESGSGTTGDGLHRIDGLGYYGGHPAPIRANPALAGVRPYRQDPSLGWMADGPALDFAALLPAGFGLTIADFPADPRQCEYTVTDDALEFIGASTNGLAEYTAGNFGGAMQGDLIAASFNGNLYRCKPDGAGGLADLPGNPAGTANGKCEVLFGGYDAIPLDVTTQGDDGQFPGTIWMAAYLGGAITVFEPVDFGACDSSDPAGDADADGYGNGDETDNGSNPCSPGSTPSDFDADGVSDLNDPDDDNDGIVDTDDPFALDAANGLATALPIDYPLFNNDPGTGLFGLGFTGLMLPGNGSTRWRDLYDFEQLAAGGAAGMLTVEAVDAGDALGAGNTQRNGFMFGVAADSDSPPFIVEARLRAPYFAVDGDTTTPANAASYGLFIGSGSQDDYLKLVIGSDGGAGANLQLLRESGGVQTLSTAFAAAEWDGTALLTAPAFDLALAIDPQAATAQPSISFDGGTTRHLLGTPVAIPPAWLAADDAQGLAIGTISTRGGGAAYGATWDHFRVVYDASAALGAWTQVGDHDEPRHEHGFVQAGSRFYLLGGRESQAVRIFDPATAAWSSGAASPQRLHHVQAVELDGLIYLAGALTAHCCDEPAVAEVHIYDPLRDRWSSGPSLPPSRLRGGVAAAAIGRQIYLFGGNVAGHGGPASAQVDRYDPATGSFTPMTDMPRARDHFHAVVHGGKVYAVGGRQSDALADGSALDDTIAEVDVYDPASNSWSTLPASAHLPTPRAGAATGVIGNELIIAGGESDTQPQAHAEVEAFDLVAQSWRTLTPMGTPRHGAQALVSNGGLYVVGGSGTAGAGAGAALPLEALHLHGATPPATGALTAGTLGAPVAIDFGTLETGSAEQRGLTLAQAGGNQALLVESLAISGDPAFTLVGAQSAATVLAPGATHNVTVRFAPTQAGSATATLTIVHAAGTTTIDLFGNAIGAGSSETTLYRINVGGPTLAAADGSAPAWQADSATSPSPLRIAGGEMLASDSDGGSYPGAVDMSHPSLPAGAPAALFQTERWDPAGGDAMHWALPVTSGQVVAVRLYFAELYSGITAPGQRVFDVAVESSVPGAFAAIDPLALAGPKGALMREALLTVTDDNLDIVFAHGVENPALKAIEVIAYSGPLPNVAPVARDDHAQVAIGGSTPIAVLGNDSDSDGSLATIELVTPPLHGSARVDAGTIVYTHAGSAPFSDRLEYRVADDDGDWSNVARVRIGSNEPALAADADGDGSANAADPDDDDDGWPDTSDPFALDPANGLATTVPQTISFVRDAGRGGLFDLGFTGLMSNGAVGGTPGSDYAALLDASRVFVGAADGSSQLAIVDVGGGDARGAANTQAQALQFGIDVDAGDPVFVVGSELLPPWFDGAGQPGQSFGLQIGRGDQQDYLKLALAANNTFELVLEQDGVVSSDAITFGNPLTASRLRLYLVVDPAAAKARAFVAFGNAAPSPIGTLLSLPQHWFASDDARGLAAGLIAGAGSAGAFTAQWKTLAIAWLASDDSFSGTEDATGLALDVQANDAWRGNATLTAAGGSDHGGSVAVDDRGTATRADDRLVYTPAADFAGIETFHYDVDTGGGITARAVVGVALAAVNDPPTFTLGGSIAVSPDAGPQQFAGFAGGFAAGGGADEAGQQLDAFIVTTDADALFTATPQIDTSGTLRFTPNPAARGTATVSVRVRDSGGSANGGSDLSAPQTFGITVAEDAQADLSVTLVDAVDPVPAGSVLLYLATVRNDGPAAASAVQLTLQRTPELGTATTSGCDNDPQAAGGCALGTLAPGAERQVSISVDVPPDSAGTLLMAEATVDAAQDDPDPSDNSASASTAVGTADEPAADLGVTLAASGEFTADGGHRRYLITVGNQGPAAVAGGRVVDALPSRLLDAQWTCNAASGAACAASGSGSIDQPVDLAPGSTLQFVLDVRIADSDPTPIVNSVFVSPPPGIRDPLPGNNAAHDSATPRVFRDGFELP